MIALCPNCHDAVHTGALPISDDTLRTWKAQERTPSAARTHLYVEPASRLKVLLGSIAVASVRNEAVVFALSPSNRLRFRALDSDLLLLELRVCSAAGDELVKVTDNHVTTPAHPDVVFRAVPGHIEVVVPSTTAYIPQWALQQVREREPSFAVAGSFPVLDLQVVRPGVVRVQGLWPQDNRLVVITRESLMFVTAGASGPLTLQGAGEDSVLLHAGPIDNALFRM
jgi:hypothetical protein